MLNKDNILNKEYLHQLRADAAEICFDECVIIDLLDHIDELERGREILWRTALLDDTYRETFEEVAIYCGKTVDELHSLREKIVSYDPDIDGKYVEFIDNIYKL